MLQGITMILTIILTVASVPHCFDAKHTAALQQPKTQYRAGGTILSECQIRRIRWTWLLWQVVNANSKVLHCWELHDNAQSDKTAEMVQVQITRRSFACQICDWQIPCEHKTFSYWQQLSDCSIDWRLVFVACNTGGYEAQLAIYSRTMHHT